MPLCNALCHCLIDWRASSYCLDLQTLLVAWFWDWDALLITAIAGCNHLPVVAIPMACMKVGAVH